MRIEEDGPLQGWDGNEFLRCPWILDGKTIWVGFGANGEGVMIVWMMAVVHSC